MEQKGTSEVFFLQISFWGNVLSVVLSIWAGLVVHSNAIMLDGVLGLIDVAVTVAIIFTIKLLLKPPTKTFQFGFYKFEPLIVALESGIIIAVCFQGVLHAIRSFYHTEPIVGYLFGFSFTSLNVLINVVVLSLLTVADKKMKSDLLHVAWLSWFMGAFTEIVIWFGFAFGVAVDFFRWSTVKPYLVYVDPILTIVVVLLVIREPIKVFYDAVENLLDAKPDDIDEKPILDQAHVIAEQQGFTLKEMRLNMREAGRALFVYLLYTPSDIKTLDQLYNFEEQLDAFVAKQMDSSQVNFNCVLQRTCKMQPLSAHA